MPHSERSQVFTMKSLMSQHAMENGAGEPKGTIEISELTQLMCIND